MAIGARIRQARGHKLFSQEDLGRAIGVSREMISQYESGDVVEYPLGRLASIAKHCGVKPCWLAFGLGSMTEDAHPEINTQVLGYLESHHKRLPVPKLVQVIEYCYQHLAGSGGVKSAQVRDILKIML